MNNHEAFQIGMFIGCFIGTGSCWLTSWLIDRGEKKRRAK